MGGESGSQKGGYRDTDLNFCYTLLACMLSRSSSTGQLGIWYYEQQFYPSSDGEEVQTQ